MIDGAHAVGALDLNVPSIQADFYCANLHKWLCTPKGTAFLWVAPERQAGLRPLVLSHGTQLVRLHVPLLMHVEAAHWCGSAWPALKAILAQRSKQPWHGQHSLGRIVHRGGALSLLRWQRSIRSSSLRRTLRRGLQPTSCGPARQTGAAGRR